MAIGSSALGRKVKKATMGFGFSQTSPSYLPDASLKSHTLLSIR
jgi:hypothetical protein